MKKVYIAAPFFNPEQLRSVMFVEEVLQKIGVDYFSPREEGVIKNMTIEEKKLNAKRLFDSNIQNMKDCDVMIAIVDDKDTGTSFEMGYFSCLGKNLITLSVHGKEKNLMLTFCVSAHLSSMEEFEDFMHHGAPSGVGVDSEIDE